jgi:hypothetical protein
MDTALSSSGEKRQIVKLSFEFAKAEASPCGMSTIRIGGGSSI